MGTTISDAALQRTTVEARQPASSNARQFRDVASRLWPLLAFWFALFFLSCQRAWRGYDFELDLMMVLIAVGIAIAASTMFFEGSSLRRLIQALLLAVFGSFICLFFTGHINVYRSGGAWRMGVQEGVATIPIYIGLATMVALIPFWSARRFLGWRFIDAKQQSLIKIERARFQLRDAMIWTAYFASLLALARASLPMDPALLSVLYLLSLTGILAPAIGFVLLFWLAERSPFFVQVLVVGVIMIVASFAGVVITYGTGMSASGVFGTVLRVGLMGGILWLLVIQFLASRGFAVSSSPGDPERLHRIRGRFHRSLSIRLAIGKKLKALIDRFLRRRNTRLKQELSLVEHLTREEQSSAEG